jgi:oligoribonuclease NrnB/cAMP/cGMP phosphodiesterase (DHH superfamily)
MKMENAPKDIYVYYHKADLDGYIGGYIMKQWLLDTIPHENGFERDINPNTPLEGFPIFMRPYNYGDDLSDDIIDIQLSVANGFRVDVYFVDCCPHQGEDNYFEQLHKLLGDRLVIIDHHATALNFIKKYEEDRNVKISGNSSIEFAGCELAAKYVMEQNDPKYVDLEKQNKYVGINRFVRMIGAYDTFKTNGFDWDDDILPFQYWLRSQCPNLEDLVSRNMVVEHMLNKELDFERYLYNDVISQGKAILSYLKIRNMKVFKDNSFYSKVEFSRVINGEPPIKLHFGYALWATDYFNNSAIFSDNNVYDDPDIIYMVISPDIHDGCFKISLYTTSDSRIDVGLIAKKMGGGGHFHAAGFKAYYIHKYDIDYKLKTSTHIHSCKNGLIIDSTEPPPDETLQENRNRYVLGHYVPKIKPFM